MCRGAGKIAPTMKSSLLSNRCTASTTHGLGRAERRQWNGPAVLLLRAIMDISAPAISLADGPQLGALGQYSYAPGRPNFHLVSSSRRPRRVSTRTQLLANDHVA